MATNADDIISGANLDSSANTAGINMDKHFEAAGIEPENKGVDKQEVADTGAQDTSAKSGEQAKPEAKTGEKPATDKGTSTGDPKDDKSKQSPDQKGAKEKEQALAPGDLKLQDGTVIKAGAERRLYETVRLEQQRVADLSNQLKNMTGSRDRHRDELVQLRNTVQSVNGAKPEEISVGLRIVRDLQRDPAGTLKNLLAEAVASGYTVEGVTSGLDAKAIEHLIENKLGNVTQQQQGPTDEQITAEAAQEATQFFSQYPDARIHEALIARVAADHPQVPLSDVYFQLRQGAINRGLDWSKPLADQVSAQQSNSGNPDTQSAKPMVNGRAVDGASTTTTTVAHESMDTGDIVKEAMREAGLNI